MTEEFCDRDVGMGCSSLSLAVGSVDRAVVFMCGVSLEGDWEVRGGLPGGRGWQTRVGLWAGSI